MLVGAGGINALSGEKLGVTLERENYLVAPPQPWLDGWKDKDGTVYQFVATAYQKGQGITVAEQLMGEDQNRCDRHCLFPSQGPVETQSEALAARGVLAIHDRTGLQLETRGNSFIQ